MVFYKWSSSTSSKRVQQRARLDMLIRFTFERHKYRSGSYKVTEALRKRGEKIHRSCVVKRMKEMDLRSKVNRKYKVTTDSKHKEPVAKNLHSI